MVLSVLVLFGGVAGGVVVVVLAAYAWKWCRTEDKRKQHNRRRSSSRSRPIAASSTLVLVPEQCQAPLIRHFQQRQLSHRSQDSNKTTTPMDGTKSLMLELATDTRKLAKLFPMINPKIDNKSRLDQSSEKHQAEEADNLSAEEKRRRFSARNGGTNSDGLLGVPPASIERGTQTSPSPVGVVETTTMTTKMTTPTTRTVALNTVPSNRRVTVDHPPTSPLDDVQNHRRHHHHKRRHYDAAAAAEQQLQGMMWREGRRTASIRRPDLPKSRVHTIAEPNFGKKSRNWPPTTVKQHSHQFVTKASNSALRERESGIWHQIQMHSTNAPSSLRVQNLSRSFEECPRVTRVQHATAWRRARSEKFVEEEEEEEDEADTYSQSARLQFEGVRYCPPPPPRRPRHAHLQRFFRSADTASASSTTTTNGSGTGCGGCSSTVSGNSSSTTMPTMEEGRRMAACWKARNPTNRLYRSVDDDYGGGDQRDRRGAAIFNDHRRLLPDVPTKMPKKSQGQFPPASFVPRLPPYTMPPPYSYRIPSVQRADPSPLARFNSLKRAKPLRRDFSVDRRTESLFRHFVRPDPFEIL